MIVLMFFLVLKAEPQTPVLSIIFGVVFILLLSLALSFYKLTILITDEYIAFSFGIGLIKKKYRLSEIKKCRPVTGKFSIYSRIIFEKLPDGGKSYILSSALPSIEITYENEYGIIKSDRVGTDNPDEITDYINKKIEQRSSHT